MTYCLAIKVKEGLVAIADTRITSGTDTTMKKKILIEQKDQYSLFIMTSGLRSVRDKASVNWLKRELSITNFIKLLMLLANRYAVSPKKTGHILKNQALSLT
jgi:putative proteasome-type protease